MRPYESFCHRAICTLLVFWTASRVSNLHRNQLFRSGAIWRVTQINTGLARGAEPLNKINPRQLRADCQPGPSTGHKLHCSQGKLVKILLGKGICVSFKCSSLNILTRAKYIMSVLVIWVALRDPVWLHPDSPVCCILIRIESKHLSKHIKKNHSVTLSQTEMLQLLLFI